MSKVEPMDKLRAHNSTSRYMLKKMCTMYTKMFIVLFAIINSWKQSNFLSAIEQIYKSWQSYTRILDSDENEQTINTHNTMGQPHKQNVE